VLAAAASLPGVDLVVVGAAPAAGVAHHIPQRGRTFGERLRHALADVRALGYDRLVAVPLDCPRLSAAELAAAFAHLEQGRPVLGPSPDGGVYLLGVPAASPAWLRGVDWCTPRVFHQLRERLPGAVCLTVLDDLDGPRDLAALARDAALPPDESLAVRAGRPDASAPYASRPPPPLA
jgi:glycosyltransferase A (GT-A) superfamily protein (DUF2064 family)